MAPTALTPNAGDVDKRRIERLVTTVIEARRLPLRILGVETVSGGWRVTLRTPAGEAVKFSVPADSMSVMRVTIERALTTEAF